MDLIQPVSRLSWPVLEDLLSDSEGIFQISCQSLTYPFPFIRKVKENKKKGPFLHKNKGDQVSLQSDFSKLYRKIPNMALWNNPIPQNCQISSLGNKKGPFSHKKQGWPGIFEIWFFKIVPTNLKNGVMKKSDFSKFSKF